MSPNKPAQSSATEYYEKYAEDYFENSKKCDLEKIYIRFLQHISEGGNILDAGCGSGRDTKHFLAQRYRVKAYDASYKLSQLASQFTGIHIPQLTHRGIRFDSEFDGIWAGFCN